MKRLMYVELKSGYSDNGPAWIGMVEFSRTGRTAYFNDKAFKKVAGVGANFYDLETGDGYWITGIKKDSFNRHWAGSGKVMIDKDVVDEYLDIVEWSSLRETRFDVVTIKQTDITRFKEIENESN
jgi:hypothetical protein